MTLRELEKAKKCGCPVILTVNISYVPRDIEYRCVTDILQDPNDSNHITAVLVDYNGISFVYADPKNIRFRSDT